MSRRIQTSRHIPRQTLASTTKSKSIGRFATKVEAARAYDIALVAMFGAENVVTNKDEGVYTDE